MEKQNNTDVFLKINKKYFSLGLKSIDILIAAQIEEFCRNNCECYVTNEQFSNMFGESESTVKRSIDKLEKLNIIKRQTKFIKGNGKGTKQRILSIQNSSNWKVHNDLLVECKVQIQDMEGSKTDDGEVKNQECKVHNGLIKDNLKENKNKTLKAEVDANAIKEETKPRRIEDLSNEEGDQILIDLKRGVKYIDIQKKYNLEFGSVTSKFKDQWREIKSNRAYWLEQKLENERRKHEPIIDYARLSAAAEAAKLERQSDGCGFKTDISTILDDLWTDPIDTNDECSTNLPDSLRIISALQNNNDGELWDING